MNLQLFIRVRATNDWSEENFARAQDLELNPKQ